MVSCQLSAVSNQSFAERRTDSGEPTAECGVLVFRFPGVEGETAGECAEVLSKDQAAAVEARLQGLRLHPQHGARLFGGQAVDVAQDDRHAIDLRQESQRLDQARPQLPAEHAVVRQRRPVGRVLRAAGGRPGRRSRGFPGAKPRADG